MYVEVLVELKAKNIDKTFTYRTPFSIKIGQRVLVPFGRQKLEGFVLSVSDKRPEYEVKDIISVVDEEPILNEEMLELGKYISSKTLTNLITCYQTMLPSALKAKNGRKINKKIISYIILKDNNYESNSLSQKKILNEFLNKKEIRKSELTKISVSSLNTLIKKGVLEEIKREEYRINENIKPEINNTVLTEEQSNVLKLIEYNKFIPYLLHGVTGSGKTEVYMRIIEQVLKEKKEAIILVPEISLTPQLVKKFKKRFGSSIAILHSRLSSGEKYDEWRKIERKEVSIVIGARSAIYAPFTNLGVIIIDEEHSSTYKQENNPKYHAIDIAIRRAKKYNIPLILGSATPSIESYTRANLGIYKLLKMEKRVNNNLPITTLVDMKDEIKKGNVVFSSILKEKIKDRLEKKEQIIILLNRRGFNTITSCSNCGFTLKCPNCDIPLIYHKTSNTMRCHYCGYGTSKLKKCPECDNEDLKSMGMGTEKLEQYINDNFKDAKVVRMDVDSTSTKGSHERIIKEFSQEKYNILVGTQMISKGLDFPKVTLVGVLNGDSSLNIPDFRSAERTFQLLNQVAGRAGRANIPGEVIIQGFNVDHYSIVKASQNDYVGFYKEELKLRKMLKYSPYYNLCLIKIKHKKYEEAENEANKICDYLKSCQLKDTFILGPSSCLIPKINNIYQLQIILKYKDTKNIKESLSFINNYYKSKKIYIDIDFNPIRL